MNHAVIVHGYKGGPSTNWKPWLKDQLEARGWLVDIPTMPNPDRPDAEQWQDTLSNIASSSPHNVYLIGHSLGTMSILRYLETVNSETKIHASIFVAGFGEKFNGYKGGHDSFFDHELDWQTIKKRCNSFIAIHSDDDKYVGIGQLDLFRENLGAKTVLAHGMGHFGSEDGVYEVPTILDEILNSARTR